MANVFTPSILNEHYNNLERNDPKNVKTFNVNLSEQDVLNLQEIFLTFGIHCIKTDNVKSGRKIINTILGSLKYYQNIGAVTDLAGLDIHVADILVDIKMQGLYSGDVIVDLENFFMIHACFDFIWVEFSGSLLERDIINLKNVFNMYYVQERMPVIFMMYNQSN